MKYLSLSFLILVGFNLFVWDSVMTYRMEGDRLNLYFLDVGQGDSQLIVLPEGGKLLIDGGPNKEASFELGDIFSSTNRYIDLVAVTHAQKDHFGGLIDVVSRYDVGVLLWNGEEALSDEWQDFKRILAEKDVTIIRLEAGDRIIQGESIIDVIAPNKELIEDPDANEGSLVLRLESEGVRALFTGDIGIGTENKLVVGEDLDVDILKVAHHGSKYSTGITFLEEATPAIAVIEVGNNRYGHPTLAVLQRLQMTGTSIYRTDKDGRVHLTIKEGLIGVEVEK